MDDTLLSAVKSGNIEVLKVFLDGGKDCNVRDVLGWGLIHHAAYNGHLECVKLILEKAKSDYKSVTEIVNKFLPSTVSLQTPLTLAAMKGHCDIVELLIDFYLGAMVDYKIMGFPLHEACKHGQNKCIKIIVKKIPQYIGASIRLDSDKSPIHITVECGNIEGTKILIENGCDLNYVDCSNCTPLFLASKNGNADMVRFFLDNGADASIPSYENCSALFQPYFPVVVAAKHGHFDVVKLLAGYVKPDSKRLAVIFAALHGQHNCLSSMFHVGFPTFNSETTLFRKNVWIMVLQQCPHNTLAETVRILLDNGTLFHSLAKLKESQMRINVVLDDVYFLPRTFAFMNPRVLDQFLNAGILEMQFNCKSFPEVGHIIEKHMKFPNHWKTVRNVSVILACMEYFPFLIWSHENPLVLPTQDNFGDGDLVLNVPSLLNLTRWTIRCLIIKRKGMINQKYVESLELPKTVTEFVVKC